MGFVHQRDTKKRICCPARWYAQPQIIYRISTGYIQIIRSRTGYPRIHGLLIAYLLFADDLVLFSDSANGLQKQLTALYKYASLWHIIAFLKQKF